MVTSVQFLAWLGNRIGKPPGFERIARRLASPEKCRKLPELCLIRDGLGFLAQPAVNLGWHVTFFGTYEPELRAIFRTVLRPGDVAMDIGANVGWHTLLMAKLVGGTGRVLAVEANPVVRRRLCDNLSLNGFTHVEVVPYAIADSGGTLEFCAPAADDPESGSGHVVAPGTGPQPSSIVVEARRLDAIVEAKGIERLDLIKIDIEGFEWPALRGGEETIARFRPHIVFEYNEEYAGRGGATPELIAEFFRVHRYRLFSVGRNWAEAIESDRWPRCADIWAAPVG